MACVIDAKSSLRFYRRSLVYFVAGQRGVPIVSYDGIFDGTGVERLELPEALRGFGER